MRKTVIAVLAGCGLLAATALPSLACSFNTQASDTQGQQQTAQAQPPSTTTAQ